MDRPPRFSVCWQILLEEERSLCNLVKGLEQELKEAQNATKH
jgi:hypothetical protein